MYRSHKKQWAGCMGIIGVSAMLCLFSINGAAAEGDVLSVKLPVVPEGEPSPFDFILDPCGLLYETDAVRYGGGTVEEGATLLFRNKDGEYDFSKYSDKLVITSEENDPVIVTLSAYVSDLDEVGLLEHEDLLEDAEPGIYLALTDDQGHEQPLSKDAEATIRVELNNGVYSFGLTGACSPDAGWQQVSVHPKVTVTWHIESAQTEEEKFPEEMEEMPEDDRSGEEIPEDNGSEEDVPEEGMSAGAKEEDTDVMEENVPDDIGTVMEGEKEIMPENMEHN